MKRPYKSRVEESIGLRWKLWMVLAGAALLSSINVVNAAPMLASPSDADAEAVGRAELIVVGHLKENSIQYDPPQVIKSEPSSRPNETNVIRTLSSWEHHATLLVSEVIKGQWSSNSIPIILPYGLEPIVGGYASHDGFMMDIRQGNTNYPTNVVQIVILPGSQMIFPIKPLVEDVSKDKIWFLTRGNGIAGEKRYTTNDLSVMNCLIQPLNLEEYYKLYLGPDPETALKSYAVGHPEVAPRIQRWLDGLAFKAKWDAILKIQDPAAKAAKLAVYVKPEQYPTGLREEMAKLGAAAVPELIKVIQAGMTNGEDLHLPVLILFDIGTPAKPAVPLLLELLKKPGKTSPYYICSALRTTGDPQAIPAFRSLLNSGDIQAEIEASKALAEMGDEQSFEAIATLVPKVQSGRSDELNDLLSALYQMDPVKAVPIVERELNDPAWAKSRDFITPPNYSAQHPAKPGLYLTGTIRDPSGSPVANALVSAANSSYRNPDVKTDANGRYEIRWRLFYNDADSPRSAGPGYYLVARAMDQNLAGMQRFNEGITNLDLTLQTGVSLSATVTDTSGKPVPNATGSVSVQNANGIGNAWIRSLFTSDAQGRIEISNVPQSSLYIVSAWAKGYSTRQKQMTSQIGQTNRIEFPTIMLPPANQSPPPR
jgi:protocatechuate 3,4-dioxygenase beta subunit